MRQAFAVCAGMLALCLGVVTPPVAGATSKGKDRAGAGDTRADAKTKQSPKRNELPRHLTAADVTRVASAWVDSIGACYKKHGLRHKKATGALRIELVVHHMGFVKRVDVVAPGVKGKRLRRLERCIAAFVRGWKFPRRRFYTAASLPFYYQRTGRGGTPIKSCWAAEGCPDDRRKARKRRRRAR